MAYKIYILNWFFSKKFDASFSSDITSLCKVHNLCPIISR